MNYPKFWRVIYKDGRDDGFITDEKLNGEFSAAFRRENEKIIKNIKTVPVESDEYKKLTGFNDAQIARIKELAGIKPKVEAPKAEPKFDFSKVGKEETTAASPAKGTKRGHKPKLKTAV